MTPDYQAAIVRSLGRFVAQGLVYKGKKPVHWCLRDRTALAEAEVEYETHTSPSIYVEFPLSHADAGTLGGTGAGACRRTRHRAHLDDDPVDDPGESGGSRFTPISTTARSSSRIASSSWRKASRPASPTRRAARSAANWRRSRAACSSASPFRHPLYERDSLGVLGEYVTLEQGTGRGAHGAGSWRGRLRHRHALRPRHLRAHRTRRPLHRGHGSRRRLEGVRRESGRGGGARRTRPALAPQSDFQHSYPPLLALPPPGDLPGDAAVVHQHGRVARERGRRKRPPSSGSRVGPRTDGRHVYVAPRLVHLPPAGLGRADPRAGLRRLRPSVTHAGHRGAGGARLRGSTAPTPGTNVPVDDFVPGGLTCPACRRHGLRARARHPRRLVRLRVEPRGGARASAPN